MRVSSHPHVSMEPQGLQTHVVDQRQGIHFDRSLFAHWLCFSADCDGCLQLNVLLRAYLDVALESASENAPRQTDESDEDSTGEEAASDRWLRNAWRHVRRAVAEVMAQDVAVGKAGRTRSCDCPRRCFSGG